MIDLLKELGYRKATPDISALPVCAFPLGAASPLFIFLCPHLSPQPHRSCNVLLLRGFPKSCWCPLCPQQHITLPLPVLLPQTHRQYFSAEAKPSSGTSKSHVLLRSASLEGCEAEAQLHKAGQGVPMDGTWLNHKGRLCLCSLT